ncbi:MAG: AMP-binding protein [Bacteroidales bacterium]|nr:AMP-binding protein [Bacteroidales bacterium]
MKQYCRINNISISESNFEDSLVFLSSDSNCNTQLIDFLREWFSDSTHITLKTSGSTGEPKNIILSKEIMINSALTSIDFFSLKENQTALLPLSAQYIAGKMMIVRALMAHLDLLIIAPTSNPSIFLDKDFDFCVMVPMQLETIILNGDISKVNKIKKLLLGGGSINFNLETQIKLLKTQCFLSYGMTETASHVAIKTLNHDLQTDCFKALNGTSFSVDERGCLIINSSTLSIKNLVTNDIVEIISPNSFIWKGRFDNVINSGGIKLFPETIEKKIEPLFNNAFYLTKKKDTILGEALVLVVESDDANPNNNDILFSAIKKLVANYEVPKEIIYQKNFKRTQTEKIIRETF